MMDDAEIERQLDIQEAKFNAFVEELWPKLPALSVAIPETLARYPHLNEKKLLAEIGKVPGISEAAKQEYQIARDEFDERYYTAGHGGLPPINPAAGWKMLSEEDGLDTLYESERFSNGLQQAKLKEAETIGIIRELLDKHLGLARVK